MAKKIRVWDGSAWQDVAPSLPYTAIHSAQASMPATGVDGQVWLDTDGTLAGQDFVPLSGGTMTGNLNTPSINAGGIAGQNYFINGGMDFWQRGTTFTGSSGSVLNLADRWKSYDISSTSRSTDVPTGQGFQYSISFSAAAGGFYPRLQYRMPSEEAAFLAGKTVTLSFWAKNGAGTAMFFSEQQFPTTANSFDGAITNLGGTTFATSGNFSTSWQKYTWTTTVHPTTATNGVTFQLIRDPSSASTTLVTGLKMELGNQATPFTRAGVTLAGEFLACQRYYQVLGALYGYALSGDAIQGLVASSPMRGNPSVTLTTSTPYAESPINVTARNGVNSTTVGSPDVNKYGSQFVRVTGFSGMTAGQSALISGGQIVLSAEL
jgi:hypothetical protein